MLKHDLFFLTKHNKSIYCLNIYSNLSEVGFVVCHLMLYVADRVDDFLTGCILLGLEGHRTMSVPYLERRINCIIILKMISRDFVADMAMFNV